MKKNLVIITLTILMSCGSETVVEEIIDDTKTNEHTEKVELTFQTVPSPLEIASLFQDAGVEYHSENTNPIENVDKYITNTQKALNLGVYGADLSYANIFDETQESMFYMSCAKKMADGLDITSAFDGETIETIEKNINNRDSLIAIINDAFWIVDAHLKENGQNDLSILIITGGWIEGLFLGTKSLNQETPDEHIMKKIAEQKYSLMSLMELLESYEETEIKELTQKMKPLEIIYSEIEEIESELTVSENKDITIIEGGSTLEYKTTTIRAIAIEIEKIRNEIIK